MDPASRNPELEAAAFADLDDLDAWRVYADWLQSRGDPRGEVASLAVSLGEGFLSQRKRIAAELAARERPWIDAWQVWAQTQDLDGVEVRFKRGFAWTLKGPLAQLRERLDALFARDPIQRLILTEVDPDQLTDLYRAQPAWFARLQYLKLEGVLGPDGAQALAEIPLTELRRLNLLQTELDDDACTELARLQTPRLTHLTLTANAIGDAGLDALLHAPARGRWQELYLGGNPIHARGVARLAREPGLAGLLGLGLKQIEAEVADFAPFADPTALPSLRWLELSGGWWRQRDLYQQLQARFAPAHHHRLG